MRGPLKHLSKGVAIYGAGDAAVTVVNFLLLPGYVRVLTQAEFGALALIVAIEAYAKVINRWGLDGAFMRCYPEREDGVSRQNMASTILWFMGLVNGLLLGVTLGSAGRLAALIGLGATFWLWRAWSTRKRRSGIDGDIGMPSYL